MESDEDVPSGVDFHDGAVALAWAEDAARKRPWRATIFDHFVVAVNGSELGSPRILELGSGPGFLAEQILDRCPSVTEYTLLDFSEAMLTLSRHRLARYAPLTRFVRADFKSDSWPAEVGGQFDFVLSLQAVHELRHQRHAPRLYTQIRSLLASNGVLWVGDHLPEDAPTPRHRLLYMSTTENLTALTGAGLSDAEVVWSEHDMALYRAFAPVARRRL